MNDLPKFLLATDADRASWREVPLTKAFLEMLEWQKTAVEDAILGHVRAKSHEEANRLDGKLEAVQEMLALIWKQAPRTSVEEEDDFIDPATRPSTLAKGK